MEWFTHEFHCLIPCPIIHRLFLCKVGTSNIDQALIWSLASVFRSTRKDLHGHKPNSWLMCANIYNDSFLSYCSKPFKLGLCFLCLAQYFQPRVKLLLLRQIKVNTDVGKKVKRTGSKGFIDIYQTDSWQQHIYLQLAQSLNCAISQYHWSLDQMKLILFMMQNWTMLAPPSSVHWTKFVSLVRFQFPFKPAWCITNPDGFHS